MNDWVEEHFPEDARVILDCSLRERVELRVLEHDVTAASSLEDAQREGGEKSEHLRKRKNTVGSPSRNAMSVTRNDTFIQFGLKHGFYDKKFASCKRYARKTRFERFLLSHLFFAFFKNDGGEAAKWMTKKTITA